MSYGSGLEDIFRFIMWIFILGIIGTILGSYFYFRNTTTIESKKRIVPTIKLTITDNKVDTLYIYKKP